MDASKAALWIEATMDSRTERDVARSALMRLVESAGLPVASFDPMTERLLVMESPQRWKALAADQRAPATGPVSHLTLTALATFVERGIRGTDLDTALRFIEGERAAGALYDDIERLEASRQWGDITDAIDRHDTALRDRGEIIGRVLRYQSADGYAYYVISGVLGEHARVESLRVMDAYTVPQWGDAAWTTVEQVREYLEHRDRLANVFIRASRP
jgi:hypothetical protein